MKTNLTRARFEFTKGHDIRIVEFTPCNTKEKDTVNGHLMTPRYFVSINDGQRITSFKCYSTQLSLRLCNYYIERNFPFIK